MSKEAFEQFAKDIGLNVKLRNDPQSPDTYFVYETETRFKVWQACEQHYAGRIAELKAKLAEAEKDAERYQKLKGRVKGAQDFEGGQQYFKFPHFEPIGNIMKGSVAQHLDRAIDRAIKSEKV